MTDGIAVPAPPSPETVNSRTVLGVCASLKPAPGRQQKSAARGLLYYALGALVPIYPNVMLLDLRDHVPPPFDGRFPNEHPDRQLQFLHGCIDRAGALLLSIPAYWSGVSGVFKNFIDVLCGPAYDLPSPSSTVFSAKPVGLIVVGADQSSARCGEQQARIILESCGAVLAGPPLAFGNLRDETQSAASLALLPALAAELARSVLTASHAGKI
jgi:NAD(P)H-dependent FMN reductase